MTRRWIIGLAGLVVVLGVGLVALTADDELIVWGGYGEEDHDDGAAYSFESDTWRDLAPSPLPPRLFTVVGFGLGTVSSGPPG